LISTFVKSNTSIFEIRFLYCKKYDSPKEEKLTRIDRNSILYEVTISSEKNFTER